MPIDNPFDFVSREHLARAERAVTAMSTGGEPESAIENGLRIHIAAARNDGQIEDRASRARLASAYARLFERDSREERARIGSLDAARMLALDVSLQREAGMLLELDVLDRSEALSVDEVQARNPDWAALGFPISTLRHAGDADLAALAAGTFEHVDARIALYVDLASDVARMPLGAEVEARVQRAAGLLSASEAAQLGVEGALSGPELVDGHEIMRQVDERRGLVQADGVGREQTFETALVARRQLRARLDDEIFAMDRLRRFAVGRADGGPRHMPMAAEAHRNEAVCAMADASGATVETLQGRIVRAASEELRRRGFPEADVSGAPMESAVARMIARESPEGELSFMGEMPGEQATRIVVDVALQRRAQTLVGMMDGMAKGDRSAAAGVDDRPEHAVLESSRLSTVLMASWRERADLEAIGRGEFDKVSDATGLRSALDRAYAAVPKDSPILEGTRRSYDDLLMAAREARTGGMVKEGSDAMARLRELVKGPPEPEVEAMWDRRRGAER